MEIREYREEDQAEILSLFYETVHTVNAKDYKEKQLDAWAPQDNDYEHLNAALRNNLTLIAIEDGKITGFADIDENGYLDHLFVHKDYQRRGIASALCSRMEEGFKRIETHASITARPFFEKRGYVVVKAQDVEIRGEVLRNYVMEKRFG